MSKLKGYIKDKAIFFRSKKTTIDVRNFNKKSGNNVDFVRNIWNKNYEWDKYFQRHPKSKKSKYYIPYDYFIYKIQPVLNSNRYALYVNDKNMYDRIFKGLGVKMPKTYFRCYNHIYLDYNYSQIKNLDHVLRGIENNVIVKKANDSFGGKDVEKYIVEKGKLIHAHTGEELDPDSLSKNFDGNYIVQEEIIQHKAIGALHQHSLNSLRIESYRSVQTNEIHVLMGNLRIGRDGSFVDNISKGGVAVGLKIDEKNKAKLRDVSYEPFSNIEHTMHPDTKIVFSNYEIPHFSKVVAAIKILSNVIPYQRILSWDFSIDQNGEPVLIELNNAEPQKNKLKLVLEVLRYATKKNNKPAHFITV